MTEGGPARTVGLMDDMAAAPFRGDGCGPVR